MIVPMVLMVQVPIAGYDEKKSQEQWCMPEANEGTQEPNVDLKKHDAKPELAAVKPETDDDRRGRT